MTKTMQKTKKHLDRCTVAEHHHHMRRRKGHSDFGFIDHLIIFSGPLIPIAVFIQAYNIWVLDKGEGLSIITWLLLLFAACTMAIYAIYHRTKPLMFTYIPLVIADSLVVAGIILL